MRTLSSPSISSPALSNRLNYRNPANQPRFGSDSPLPTPGEPPAKKAPDAPLPLPATVPVKKTPDTPIPPVAEAPEKKAAADEPIPLAVAPPEKKTPDAPVETPAAKPVQPPAKRSGSRIVRGIFQVALLLTGVAIGGFGIRAFDKSTATTPTAAHGTEHPEGGEAHPPEHGKTDEHGTTKDDHGKGKTKADPHDPHATGKTGKTGGTAAPAVTVTSVRKAEFALVHYYYKKANLVTAHLNTWKGTLNNSITDFNYRQLMSKNITNLNNTKAALEKAGVTDAFLADPKSNPSPAQVKALENYLVASYEGFNTLEACAIDVILKSNRDPRIDLIKGITDLKTKGGGQQAADTLLDEVTQHTDQFRNVWNLSLPNVHIERHNPY